MQRKYRRSLSTGSVLSQAPPRYSSLSTYENWQRYTSQAPVRHPSPPSTRYHPYGHQPRTPPATPDQEQSHLSPQHLPSLFIPGYSLSSSRSPPPAQTQASYSRESSISAGCSAKLPDIHTVFSSPSPSPNNLQLPPLQPSWRRSLSEPRCSAAYASDLASPTTNNHDDQVKNRMCLDTLLSWKFIFSSFFLEMAAWSRRLVHEVSKYFKS